MKHILILFTDQQRFDTIGSFGNKAIQTPNLDELAAQSVVFNHCITPSPVCVPARLSMLSGQYPARTGCNNNNQKMVYQGEGFYSRITRQGWQSCCVGKMHYFPDLYCSLGFEKRCTQEEMANPKDDYFNYIREKYPYVFDIHGMRSEMYYVPQISPYAPADHPTQWVADRSIEYIEQCDTDRNMFLVSSFIHPHPPYCPPAPWNKLYRQDPPEPYNPDQDTLEGYWELIGDRHSIKRLMISEQDLLRMKNYYYACVSFVDYQIGRIVNALKKKGIYEDTLILFASDHGDLMGDFGACGKRCMVEPVCHIPFMVRYPGKQHQVREDVCSLIDVAPTLLKYAGIPYDTDEFDGIDLFGGGRHEYVFSQYDCGKEGTYMVTDGINKLVHHPKTGRYFYFDTVPENHDTYSEDNAEAQKLKTLLDAYCRSDASIINGIGGGTTEPKAKHPHYVGRMDHKYLHDLEMAEIPEPYNIDL